MSIFGKPFLTGVGKGSASEAVASFTDGAKGLPLKSLLVSIDPVQAGSGDPSPDNVRPISGWSEVNVWRTGVNVWDEEWESGGLRSDNGEKYADNNRIRSKNYISVKPSTRYYMHIPSQYSSWKICFYDINKTFLSYTTKGNAWNEMFDTPANCYWIMIGENATDYGTTYNNDISVNYPSTITTYIPYSGNQYTLQLGQTVYGGTLDVLGGVLTVDRAMVNLGTLGWTSQTAQNQYSYYSLVIDNIKRPMTPMNLVGAICSQYKEVVSDSFINRGDCKFCISSTGRINVNDNRYATASAFQTAMSGVQLVYELATPITISLTPQEISTLQGQNNVWADTGDSMVEYLKKSLMHIGSSVLI